LAGRPDSGIMEVVGPVGRPIPVEDKSVRFRPVFALTILWAAALAVPAPAQEAADVAELKESAPKVFLDFERGDMNYIRTEIAFVNYVRDRKEADVHVLVTTQRTASGGTEYTFSFIGLEAFEGADNTLVYASSSTETDEEVRRGYTSVLKMGLVPYTARTPIRNLLTIGFREKVRPTDVVDPWKFWIFSLSAGGDFEKESQRSQTSLDFTLAASKITPDLKIQLWARASLDREDYEYEGTTITGKRNSESFSGLFAKGLGEHWSVGVFLNFDSSTYGNLDVSVRATPALEYDLFPYTESTRRQLRFIYRIGPEINRYRQETLYGKTKETLWGQSLSAGLEIKEEWGSLDAGLVGSHYFHDLKKNRLEFAAELSFRIFKGLELNIDAGYERIRDQLSLPKGDATLEEVLLEQRELATEYQLNLQVGLSFTFGSIFSNVVNPRFGNQSHYH
jgi:hypothetical protein